MSDGSTVSYVMSPDGARIAYAVAGSGPPLVLVPGANGHHHVWDHVLPFLVPHVTTYAIARRGRGPSTETDPSVFDIDAESEDVLAVVAAAGGRVHLAGHSSGAVVALETARRAPRLRGLALYEPRFAPEPGEPRGQGERLRAMLDAGDRDGVIAAVMRDEVGMADEISFWRASPSWPRLEAIAHIFIREIARLEEYRFDPTRFAQLDVPTLLLSGGRSPAHFRRATARVCAALPNAKIVELPGQGHNAIVSAPERFAAALLASIAGIVP